MWKWPERMADEMSSDWDTAGVTEALVRLYMPEAAPAQVTERFEATLRERASGQLAAVPAARQRSWMPRVPIAAGIAVCAAFLVGMAAVVLMEDRGTPRVAQAQAFLAEVPDSLEVSEGQIHHLVIEGYVRYGSKADEIRARDDLYVTPEHYIQEVWTEFDSADAARRVRSILRDSTGNVIQDNWTSTERIESGDLIPVNAPAERAAMLRAELDSGAARVLELDSDHLTIESRYLWHELFPNGRGDIAIPWAEDLSPVELIREIAIRQDGMLLYGRTYVTTPSGEKVLIESRETVVIEFLDSVPAGIFEGK